MKTIEYRDVIDKTEWGAGPWQGEPDKKQWLDGSGLPCLAVRHGRRGHWCGYVGVAEGHPYHGLHHDAVDVEVHGELSFSASCNAGDTEGKGICHKVEPGEPDHVWWFGFDCHHYLDLAPGNVFHDRVHYGWEPDEQEVYRDLAYVEGQCRRLAQQLIGTSAEQTVPPLDSA